MSSPRFGHVRWRACGRVVTSGGVAALPVAVRAGLVAPFRCRPSCPERFPPWKRTRELDRSTIQRSTLPIDGEAASKDTRPRYLVYRRQYTRTQLEISDTQRPRIQPHGRPGVPGPSGRHLLRGVRARGPASTRMSWPAGWASAGPRSAMRSTASRPRGSSRRSRGRAGWSSPRPASRRWWTSMSSARSSTPPAPGSPASG